MRRLSLCGFPRLLSSASFPSSLLPAFFHVFPLSSSFHISPPRHFFFMSAADGGCAGVGEMEANDGKVGRHEAYLEAVLQKRIRMFERIQAEQIAHRQEIGGELIKITLPDGNVKEGKKWLTSPMDVAKEISKGLFASALISKVNGTLWDMTRPLVGDCQVELFKFDSNEGRDTFWHSSAHILGESLEREYGCKLCIGPCTTRGEGFYYDAFYNGLTLNEEHFDLIKLQAMKAVAVMTNQMLASSCKAFEAILLHTLSPSYGL